MMWGFVVGCGDVSQSVYVLLLEKQDEESVGCFMLRRSDRSVFSLMLCWKSVELCCETPSLAMWC